MLSKEPSLLTLPGPRDVEDLARRGICEGLCVNHGGHQGEACVTKIHGTDGVEQGSWSYCATARAQLYSQHGMVSYVPTARPRDEPVAMD